MRSPIYRYGKPIEGIPFGEASAWWLAEGTQASWEDYVRSDFDAEFALWVDYGVAETEQYQVMSITYDYDPVHGAYVPSPF